MDIEMIEILKEFDDYEAAYEYARRIGRGVKVRVKGRRLKVYPSGVVTRPEVEARKYDEDMKTRERRDEHNIKSLKIGNDWLNKLKDI